MWCLQENTFDASIGKLVELKPEIYTKIEALKVTAANTAAIKELQQNTTSKKTSGGRGGWGNSNGDSKVYKDCKTCGKRHPGICWDLEKSNSNQKKRNRKFLTREDAKDYMKTMIAQQCKHQGSDSSGSDSEDKSLRRELNKAEQMHVLASSGNNPNNSDIEFDRDELRRYKKQARKYFKKKRWELPKRQCKCQRCVTPVIIATANGTLYPINTAAQNKLKGARRFSEVILSIKVDGKEVIARCLLDTGCTKSMILKNFTDQKRRTKLSDKNSIKYETYGSSFKSSMTASVGFKMVEFETQKNNTIDNRTFSRSAW